MKTCQLFIHLIAVFALVFLALSLKGQTNSKPFIISTGWQLQDVSKINQTGEEISLAGFQPKGWLAATVPGTVLTSLVNDKIYPVPLWGENNRPDKIPESLCRTREAKLTLNVESQVSHWPITGLPMYMPQ